VAIASVSFWLAIVGINLNRIGNTNESANNFVGWP
jgi:hypothetical protein